MSVTPAQLSSLDAKRGFSFLESSSWNEQAFKDKWMQIPNDALRLGK